MPRTLTLLGVVAIAALAACARTGAEAEAEESESPLRVEVVRRAPISETPLPVDHSSLYQPRPTAETRWWSFENRTGAKGAGGTKNQGAKGDAWDPVKAGETKVLMDHTGSGVIRRIWLTVDRRNQQFLRSLRVDMYWDGANEPAVSVPLGDFFSAPLGRLVRHESSLFSSPEGRSFTTYIPMPFRTHARVTVTNEATEDLGRLYYDIDVELDEVPEGTLYFHATWRRERWNELGRDFTILPQVRGDGRFLGAHVGVITHPDNIGWWGEGEVKMYVDGDGAQPTIVGTGAEDYIGTGWGMGTYIGQFQGGLVADRMTGEYTFYRYHVPDPVFFHKDIRVTMQTIGGSQKRNVVEMQRKGVAVRPVSVAWNSNFELLLEQSPPPELATHEAPDNAWVNHYRRDDWSATAFFYLDRAENGLPPLAGIEWRVAGLPTAAEERERRKKAREAEKNKNKNKKRRRRRRRKK